MARNDIHSTKNFQPDDYDFVDHFGHMKVPNMDRQDHEGFTLSEPYGEHVMAEYDERGHGKDNPHADMFQCDICGARFVHGAGLIHRETNLLITVGGQCMEGIALVGSLKVGQKWEAVKRDRKRRERAGKMRKMLVENPGINAALKTDHYISKDLRAKALEWGDLSEKQIALAFKLQSDVANRPDELEGRPVPADGERHTVEATILGTKLVDGYMGGQEEKMLVQVEVDGGAFKLYGGVPAAIADAQWDGQRQRLEDDPEHKNAWPELKGAKIKFTARFKIKDDPNFAIISRPTKVSVLKWGDE